MQKNFNFKLYYEPLESSFLYGSSLGYWLENFQNSKSHTLRVGDSGNGSHRGEPFKWNLQIGDLEIESGSISGSAFDELYNLDAEFDDILGDKSFQQNIDFFTEESRNLLDKKFPSGLPEGLPQFKTYDKGLISISYQKLL